MISIDILWNFISTEQISYAVNHCFYLIYQSSTLDKT
jgi:hypothetical protein